MHGDNFQLRLDTIPSRREPDLSFVAEERMKIETNTFVDGAPDLALEIVSPESTHMSLVEKFRERTQAAGVSEYWMIDP